MTGADRDARVQVQLEGTETHILPDLPEALVVAHLVALEQGHAVSAASAASVATVHWHPKSVVLAIAIAIAMATLTAAVAAAEPVP